MLADAEAQVRAWLPSTRRTYGAAWRHFSHWCEEQGVSTQPASPCTVAKFLKELVEQQGPDAGHCPDVPSSHCRHLQTGRPTEP